MSSREKIKKINEEKLQIERDGKTVECDILFTFNSDDTLKAYVGYTDNTIAPNGRKNIYVCSYDPFDEEYQFENVTDEKEIAMVHDVLNQIYKESQNS